MNRGELAQNFENIKKNFQKEEIFGKREHIIDERYFIPDRKQFMDFLCSNYQSYGLVSSMSLFPSSP